MITTITEENKRTFVENVSGALNGCENQLVTINSSGKLIAAGVGDYIGTMVGKLTPGQPEVAVRLVGKNGTMKCIQSDTIAIGAKVMQDPSVPARIQTWDASEVLGNGKPLRCLGTKIGPNAGAEGDIVEIIDTPELPIVKQAAATMTATAAALDALTFTAGGATGPQVEALRAEVKKAVADIAAIKAELLAAGLTYVS